MTMTTLRLTLGIGRSRRISRDRHLSGPFIARRAFRLDVRSLEDAILHFSRANDARRDLEIVRAHAAILHRHFMAGMVLHVKRKGVARSIVLRAFGFVIRARDLCAASAFRRL